MSRLPIWKFFFVGARQNDSHKRAHCIACLAQARPDDAVVEVEQYMGINTETEKDEDWFKAGDLTAVAADAGVRGEKSAMIAHLVGRQPCKHATDEARDVARSLQPGSSTVQPAASGKRKSASSEQSDPKRARTATQARVERQSTLKTYRGIDIPFSAEQAQAIEAQFLRATISANLPFRWVEDPEVIALFLLFRSAACDVMPSRKVLANRLLDQEHDRCEAVMKEAIGGKAVTLSTDGWKDISKNSVGGVNVATGGKPHLLEVIRTNGHEKDGPAMSRAFEGMIDRAEQIWKCLTAMLVTDNDGAAQWGRDDVAEKRPWIFVSPCIGHQGQLILADYFRENPDAEKAGEQAAQLVGWLNNHQRVREIFDEVQRQKMNRAEALKYISANLTRWTTHLLSFLRLLELKDPMQAAVYMRREDIVAAQVGAEKNKKKKAQLDAAARAECRVILDEPGFWDPLALAAQDLEPIAYLTNINQKDATRPDQVLLGFAGIYLHFAKHDVARIRTGMTRRIEQRWKALDQAVFFFALVLNPYEFLQRFGDKAGIDVFVLDTELIELYRRHTSRPPPEDWTAEQVDTHEAEKHRKETEVSRAFLEYAADKGPWVTFRQRQAAFSSLHGTDPKVVWEQMLGRPDVKELAQFALILLDLTCHQGGMERVFSDMGIKKTDLRNRLGLKKLEKMCKIAAQIRTEHMAAGLATARAGRKNHDDSRAAELLAVPRYVEVLDGVDGDGADSATPGQVRPPLVTSATSWRRQLATWKADDSDLDTLGNERGSRRNKGFFPRSLSLLFGGTAKKPATAPAKRSARWSKEQLYAELLAAEWEGEDDDDGAQEGSGDEYEE